MRVEITIEQVLAIGLLVAFAWLLLLTVVQWSHARRITDIDDGGENVDADYVVGPKKRYLTTHDAPPRKLPPPPPPPPKRGVA